MKKIFYATINFINFLKLCAKHTIFHSIFTLFNHLNKNLSNPILDFIFQKGASTSFDLFL